VLTQAADNGNSDIFIAPQGCSDASGPEIISIVQEIDIRTGKVLFQWNSADHVPYRDSHNPRPASAATRWDWFHINAVHLDTDGNLLINSRYTWTTYKVSPRTGKIIWEFGGKQSTFKLAAAPGQVLDSAGEIFAFQTTRNGDLFVGWGRLPYISEFSPSGRLLFNAEFPAGVSTYRAYLLPWHPAG
jgi:Arylsulfotransferase (ASST)